MLRIIIFANGILPDSKAAQALIQADDFLIAADGGAGLMLKLGILPNLVIGDLDSLSAAEITQLNAAQVEIIKHPIDKNETDLELAIQHALTFNPTSILVVAALGGRMDQTLANIALLNINSLSQINIRLDDGVEEIFFCGAECQIHGTVGDTVSLIPWQGNVNGVTTSGLKWTLNNEMLFANKTRGISNEMHAQTAAVKIKSGLLLVIHRRNS